MEDIKKSFGLYPIRSLRFYRKSKACITNPQEALREVHIDTGVWRREGLFRLL